MLSPSSMCASCFRAAQRVSVRTAASRSILHPPSLRAYTIAARQTLHHGFSSSTQTAQGTQRAPRRPLRYINPISTRRPLATATAAPSQPNTPQPARAILHPRTTPSGDPMRISLSPRATHRLSAISTSDANPSLALRVSIESGGCHGFQYLMNLVDLEKSPATEEDTVFEGDQGAKVVIDEASLELLNGSTVDYTMELIGSQFKVTGIPGATSSCGCGTSFDIKL